MPDISASIQMDLEQFRQEVEALGVSYQELAKHIQDYSEENKKSAKDAADVNKELDKIEKEKKEMQRLQERMYKDSWTRTEDRYKEFIANMQKQGGWKGILGEVSPKELSGFDDALSTVKKSFLAELPFGGLLGLMFLGGKRSEEIRAMGTSIGRDFLQAGEVGKNTFQSLGQSTAQLGIMLGKGPTGLAGDIDAVAKTFSAAGVTSKEAMGMFTDSIDGVRGNIVNTSFAIDSFFKLGSGTAAKAMGDISKDFNISLKESANIVIDMGLKSRDAGMNMMSFTSSIMRASAALRSQAIDIREVVNAQMAFQDAAMKSMQLNPQDQAARRFAGEFAARATQQVTQAMANMDIGMSSVLGERISQANPNVTGGKQIQGLDAAWAFKTGMSTFGQTGEQSDFFKGALRQMMNVTKEAAGDNFGSQMQFMTQRMGLGTEAAQILAQMLKEDKDGKSIDEMAADHSKALKNAFIDRAAETSTWQRALLQIQNGIATIGMGILSAVVTGFQIVGKGIEYLMARFSGNTERADQLQKYIAEGLFPAADKAFSTIGHGAQQVFAGLKTGKNAVMSFGGPSEDAFFKGHKKRGGFKDVADEEQDIVNKQRAALAERGESFNERNAQVFANIQLAKHHKDEANKANDLVDKMIAADREKGVKYTDEEISAIKIQTMKSLIHESNAKHAAPTSSGNTVKHIKKSMPSGVVGEHTNVNIKVEVERQPTTKHKRTEE